MDTVKVPSKVQEGPLIKKFLQNKIKKKAGCKQGVMAAVNAKEGEQVYKEQNSILMKLESSADM